MRNNLSQLCLIEKYKAKRDLIVDDNIPQVPEENITKTINSLEEAYETELKTLNKQQKQAVLSSIACTSYHTILGVPGSGKIHTMVALTRILASLGKKVLIVSFANNAVDNILLRLKQSGFNKFVRLTHNEASLDPALRDNAVISSQFKTMKQINDTLKENFVYGCTCNQT